MGKLILDEVIAKPLKKIGTTGGQVLRVLKNDESSFNKFGEAYFSTIEKGVVRAWKRHNLMTLNIVVPVGEIRFVFFDGRKAYKDFNFKEFILSEENYNRLTVPPKVWMGFQGLGDGLNLLLNIADVKHDPKEFEIKTVEKIDFNWDQLQ